MLNKKLEWKRVGIYFVLSYLIAYVPEIILGSKMGNIDDWTDPKLMVFMLFATFSPALAVVLTRWMTKEGWKDSYLHIHFKGNLKYYLLATFLGPIFGIGEGVLLNLMLGKMPFAGFSLVQFLGIFLLLVGMAIPLSFINFGEELGWRGYLYPKLEKLIGIPGTIIIGGIVWGLWHAPLTVKGHNFGTDYPGFPYVGLILMSLYCTGLGIFLMWLTRKTNSVYPASIAHSVNNNAIGAISYTIASTTQEEEMTFLNNAIVLLSTVTVLGIIFTILMLKENKSKSIPAEN